MMVLIVIRKLFKCALVAGSFTLLGNLAFAQTETECTEVSIDFSASGTMTQKEKIAAMDRALNRSLNKYDTCTTSDSNASSTENGGGEGGAGQDQGSSIQEQSTQATGISGTAPPPPVSTAPETSPETSPETTATQIPPISRPNGKAPDDIPAENNDDILAQRIRSAAENEPDPVKREKLWNEYRKYKGLPLKMAN
ncbi:hypothetical protein [Sneathiella aquimaris]|uniref:hypothetical protein n=1 Tax=Sneathiella aquimaris TaxID=2599305 RepID=UPI00146B541D|nr:hypothetical protein [Sneathiella aquimaris]